MRGGAGEGRAWVFRREERELPNAEWPKLGGNGGGGSLTLQPPLSYLGWDIGGSGFGH